MIEIGGDHHDHHGEGDIIVGQRRPEVDDHLSGFYSVDFDDFATGDAKPKKPLNEEVLEKSPKKLSVHVSGLRGDDARELAQLFKDGRVDGNKAYISRPEDEIPSGFNKITLPFLDPSQADQFRENLPPVFIAPVGYKVPAGYKGHPLPFDPASVDRLTPSKVVHSTDGSASVNDIDGTTKTKNPFLANRNKPAPKRTSTTQAPVTDLVEDLQATEEDKTDAQTSSSSLFDTAQNPSSIVLNKLKLARNRPSLTTFYNKTRSQQSAFPIVEDEPDTANVNNNNKKRKRVLTKVVRKPYNPETTTPPPVASTDYKTTVVRIVNPLAEDEQVEFQTRANPSITTSQPEQEETTESHVWTTIRPDEPEPEVEVTTDQATVAVDEVKADASAEPSDQVQTFVATTTVPTTYAQETSTATTTSTTTTTVTTATTTTTTVSTVNAYEPTPANHENRLDRFRNKNRKQAHKIFASFPANEGEEVKASEEEVATSSAASVGTAGTTSTDRPYGLIRNRLNLRKYGFNTNNPTNSFEANSAANVFGQRIRARKRPTPWTPGYDEEDYPVGATPETTQSSSTTKKSKAEQYKKKFRPFFDQLYDQLTSGNDKQHDEEEEEEGEEVDEDGEPVRGWARRSTTTPNPFTINAEIYEVHPDSRERITTTKATTTTTTFLPPTTTLAEQDHDYEAGSRVDDQAEDDVVYVDTNNPAPLEYVEFKLKNFDTTEVPLPQFDIAFKPSQVEHGANLEQIDLQIQDETWNAISVPPEIPASAEPQPDENDQEVIATLFSEVMQHNHAPEQPVDNVEKFIHFQPLPEEPKPVTPSRLHDYEKNIQPQLQHWADDHFEQGPNRKPILNEHSQQHMHASEGDFIPFQPRDPEGLRPAYVEIKRKPVHHHDLEDDEDIHNVIDQAYQLEEVQAPAADVQHHKEVSDQGIATTESSAEEGVTSEDGTTQTIFVTRPTTTVSEVTEHVEEDDENEKVTTERPLDEAHEEIEIEPLPEGEAPSQEDHETSTQQDYFEVTTFRPKVTGGFFENFNLGNILGYILPTTTTTTTTTTSTPPPTTVPEETTSDNVETTVRPQDEAELVVDDEVVKKAEIAVEHVAIDGQEEEEDHRVVPVDDDVEEEFNAATETTVGLIDTTPEVVAQTTNLDEEQEPEVEVKTEADDSTVDEVTTQEPSVSELPPIRSGRPKAIAQPGDEEVSLGNELLHVSDSDAIKTSNISKSVYGAIKREEYLKNWVANRKYHNKFNEAGNKHGVIIGVSSVDEVTAEEDVSDESIGTLPFIPTVLPNINKDETSEWETSGVSIKAKRRKVNPLLDKLSSSRKSLKDSLFAKSISSTSQPTTTATTSTTTSSESSSSNTPLYPRGSDTKVFKQWQGDSLSQAEFERKVLGVSTATEVSVKSVICVRGRCYNADNVPSLVGH